MRTAVLGMVVCHGHSGKPLARTDSGNDPEQTVASRHLPCDSFQATVSVALTVEHWPLAEYTCDTSIISNEYHWLAEDLGDT